MNKSEQIERVVTLYAKAAKQADLNALSHLCTPAMLQQFTLSLRIMIKLACFFMPERMDTLTLDDIKIESKEEDRAVVSYTTNFKKKHRYERIVLLKDQGNWKIDGKFA